MNLEDRYLRLLKRRAPSEDRQILKYSESFESRQGVATRYLIGALAPVDARYTARLVEQGDRVENQLSRRLQDDYPSIQFRRQGSVSNLTHIRYYSDVDLLVLIDKFVTLEPPQVPAYPYYGVPEDDLAALRFDCKDGLSTAFPSVEFDDSGSTALKMKRSASLTCDVDIVPANWYDTLDYRNSGDEGHRGVQVLDRTSGTRRTNAPFLFNRRLDVFDARHHGIPRMLIRLLKTVKMDLEDQEPLAGNLTSFDICSLVYRYYPGSSNPGDLLALLEHQSDWLYAVANNESLQSGVRTIDDSREIFDSTSKAIGFGRIVLELLEVLDRALVDARRLVLAEYQASR